MLSAPFAMPPLLRNALLSGLSLTAGCTLSFDRDAQRGCLEDCLPGTSCCAWHPVEGGAFDRSYDRSGSPAQPEADEVVGFEAEGAAPAFVSSFGIDAFEVSVGRFRHFLEDYDGWRALGAPHPGDGAHPSVSASGWQSSWSAALPPTRAALEAELTGCGDRTFDAGNPLMPVNCVSFYVAFAFCVWDGGRLPSEAEWNYAAAGGSEQRAFPWSVPPESLVISEAHAVFEGAGAIAPVGSRAALDASRFGAHDLAGNLREWMLDTLPAGPESYRTPCNDCVELEASPDRVRRSGDFAADVARARTAYRSSDVPAAVSVYNGVRCARALE
jgi:sulfatase modifying factor 1